MLLMQNQLWESSVLIFPINLNIHGDEDNAEIMEVIKKYEV